MWIKLHDSWLEWEWHTDPNMVSLFFHLVSMASKFDTRYRGMELKRGQVIVGRRMLSEKTGISERTIRTCLARLEQTGEIIRKATNQFSVITICNYEHYQQKPTQSDQQLTSNRPATDQQPTTLIEYKSIEDNSSSLSAREKLENETINNSLWLDQASMDLRMADVVPLAVEVMNGWELTKIPDDEWTVFHLVSGMRKLKQIRASQQSRLTKKEQQEARRAELKSKVINNIHHIYHDDYSIK